MKIFCIDSTSYIPRVAIVEDGKRIYEKQWVSSGKKWNNMVSWDVSYLIDDFFDVIERIKNDKDMWIEDCDLICYSGYSGFQSTMNLGKILSKSLGIKYWLEVVCVDHISAHYFSQFTNCIKVKNNDVITPEFPVLFFSASGSHNSLALLKDFTNLTVLHDRTHFDTKEDKFLGLGSIYYRACKACEILDMGESTDNISEKLKTLKGKPNEGLVEEFIANSGTGGVFDMNLHELLFFLEANIESLREKYKYNIIFHSFEEAIFRVVESKIQNILQAN
jgi:tRNA A37 threonylcarbamoyltransferase TsaD